MNNSKSTQRPFPNGIEPASLSEFRGNVAAGLLRHALVIAVCGGGFLWSDHQGRTDLAFLSLMALLLTVLALWFMRAGLPDFRHRLADLYPNASLPGVFFSGFVRAYPLFAVPVYAFALLKEKDGGTLPWFFRHPRWGIALGVMLMAAPVLMSVRNAVSTPRPAQMGAVFSPTPAGLGFWTCLPTGYYLISTLDEVHDLLELKQTLNARPAGVVDADIVQRTEIRSITGAILTDVLVVNEAIRLKAKERETASAGVSASYRLVVEGTLEVMRRWEKRAPIVFRSNPLNLFFEGALVELSLLALTESAIEHVARVKIVQILQEKIDQAAAKDEALASLWRESLRNTKTFQTTENLRGSWFERLTVQADKSGTSFPPAPSE